MNDNVVSWIVGLVIGVAAGIFVGFGVGEFSAANKKDKENFQDHVTNYECIVKVEDKEIVCIEPSGRKFVLPQ